MRLCPIIKEWTDSVVSWTQETNWIYSGSIAAEDSQRSLTRATSECAWMSLRKWGASILRSKNKSSSPLSSLLGVQKHFQGLTQNDDKRYRFVPTAGQGSQTNRSKAVRNYWFDSAAIGANERIKPQAETEDSS